MISPRRTREGLNLNDETTNVGDAGGIWDRVWRGRASSHRRGLANVAAEASRVATLIAEGARLVDHLPSENRTLEIHGVCDEIVELTESMRAVVDHLRGEAGPMPKRRRLSFWYALRRSFVRWLRG